MIGNPVANVITPQEISSYLAAYLANSPDTQLNGVRAASVLVPLISSDDGIKVLYTRRSEKLKNHRGQVAFPGGGADPEDTDVYATALREANEEIGLPADHVRILGKMPAVTSSSRYNVTPVVGWIEKPFEIVANPDEVAHVFTVPLSWLSERNNVDFRDLETPWGRHRNVVFFKDYTGETIWGFTGQLTVKFLQIIHRFVEK